MMVVFYRLWLFAPWSARLGTVELLAFHATCHYSAICLGVLLFETQCIYYEDGE